MDTNNLREVVRRRPFEPFKLRMNDGRGFFIPHPEYIAVSKRLIVVIAPTTEVAIHIEPLLVASVHFEAAPSSPASGTNGS